MKYTFPFTVLKKHMKEKKRMSMTTDERCSVERVDDWLTKRKEREVNLTKV